MPPAAPKPFGDEPGGAAAPAPPPPPAAAAFVTGPEVECRAVAEEDCKKGLALADMAVDELAFAGSEIGLGGTSPSNCDGTDADMAGCVGEVDGFKPIEEPLPE